MGDMVGGVHQLNQLNPTELDLVTSGLAVRITS